MRVDKNSGRKPFELSVRDFQTLHRLAKQGASLSKAATEIGVDRKTIRKACEQNGLGQWLADSFPPQSKGGSPGGTVKTDTVVRKLKPEQIAAPLYVPGSVQVKWLTREWRVAA